MPAGSGGPKNAMIRPRRRKSKKRRIPHAQTGSADGSTSSCSTTRQRNGGAGTDVSTADREPLHDVPLAAVSHSSGKMRPDIATTGKRRRRTYAPQPHHVPMLHANDERGEDELNFIDICSSTIKTDKEGATSTTTVESQTAKTSIAFDPKLLRSAPGILQAREMGMLSRIVGKQKRRRMQPPQPQVLDDVIWNNESHYSGQWFKTLMLCRSSCATGTTSDGQSVSQQEGPRPRRRWEWKPHVHRSIPFRALDTPPDRCSFGTFPRCVLHYCTGWRHMQR